MPTPTDALIIPATVVEQIKEHVTLDQPGALEAFVADALSSYTHMGSLAESGATFWVQDGNTKVMRRITMPFEVQEKELAQ